MKQGQNLDLPTNTLLICTIARQIRTLTIPPKTATPLAMSESTLQLNDRHQTAITSQNNLHFIYIALGLCHRV